jgi:hypothetical protein
VVWAGLALAVCTAAAVIAQRIALAIHDANVRRLAERYQPVIDRAMTGDPAALAALRDVPRRRRLGVAKADCAADCRRPPGDACRRRARGIPRAGR